MTKSIRIENADTSDHKVNVFVERRLGSGEWVRTSDPTKLNYPTAMHVGLVFQEQRLVIEEAPREPVTGG